MIGNRVVAHGCSPSGEIASEIHQNKELSIAEQTVAASNEMRGEIREGGCLFDSRPYADISDASFAQTIRIPQAAEFGEDANNLAPNRALFIRVRRHRISGGWLECEESCLDRHVPFEIRKS